jgi:hypothetical protein
VTELAAVRDGLLAAGLPPGAFRIEGVHEPPSTDFWFLRPAGPRWEVGAYERGRWDVRLATGSLPAAVAALL